MKCSPLGLILLTALVACGMSLVSFAASPTTTTDPKNTVAPTKASAKTSETAILRGQSRQPLQPQLPPDNLAAQRPNPLRNAPQQAKPMAPPATRGAVRLASGEAPAADAPMSEVISLAVKDFPQPPAGGSLLDGFAEEAPAVNNNPFVAEMPAKTATTPEKRPETVDLAPPAGDTSLFAADPFGEGTASVTPAAPAASPFELPQAPAETHSFPIAEQPLPAQQPSTPAPAAPQSLSPQPQINALFAEEPAPVRATPEPEVSRRAVNNTANSSAAATSRKNTRSPGALAPGAVAQQGTGLPGPDRIQGPQAPQLVITKQYPDEIQVDQPAVLRTVVKNIGKTTAEDVVLTDQLPQGARFISSNPSANETLGADMHWHLGTMEPGDEEIVEMQIVPLREGELGSIARISFTSNVSGRTQVTKPMLRVEVKSPQQIMLGETISLDILLSNPGTGTATGIELEEFVPEGLYHKDGKQLVNKIGKLKPKETMKLSLPLKCVGAGNVTNRMIVRADGNISVEEKTLIQVLAPILQLEIAGAKTRYLERQAVYRLTVSNPGTASAANVDLVCQLPTSMKFVKTNQSGLYEASTHTVHWALEELPAGEAGEIELVALPTKVGDQKMKFTGVGRNGLKAETLQDVIVDGLASVSFSVKCLSDLVEVGRDTTYEINVVNRGTKEATNVVVGMQLSKGMTFVNADGPTKHKASDGIVQFASLGRLEAKQEKTYQVTARCLDDGDHRISVKLISDDLQAPITKEESTRVIGP